VIPTLLVVGLLLGRWWLVPIAAIAWVVLLALTNDLGVGEAPAAAVLATANAAVGVALHKLVALPLGRLRAGRTDGAD
jgi:hypothetical protein